MLPGHRPEAATFGGGALTIGIPKPAPAKPRKVRIGAGRPDTIEQGRGDRQVVEP